MLTQALAFLLETFLGLFALALLLRFYLQLLRAPVRSDTGLGIGLYQAARQADAAGYALRLEANRDGEVCFALRRAAP